MSKIDETARYLASYLFENRWEYLKLNRYFELDIIEEELVKLIQKFYDELP